MIDIKSEGKKVTESFFREEFYNWYDGYPDESEIEQYMEDEGMPDMVSDLSRTDMENILNHFDPDRLEDIYAQEDEGNRIIGGWQFDEGEYDDEDLEESVHPVTESFREDFLDWYDFLSDEKREEVDSFMEDEGYPDMVTDLSDSDMELIMDHFNPDYFDNDDYDEDQELDEAVLTESRDVLIGLYGDDCGSYGSLDALLKALKSAGLKVTELSGDEDYGWEFNVYGDAKKIFKMIDGEVPGYDCDDVQDFVDQYEIEVDEDHEGDPTDYAWRGVPDDFDPNEVDEGCKTEDTVKKSNGKWTNKGKDGEHGEFKSKKAADAQRKAMFANGYKAEALGSPEHPSWLDEDEYSDFDDNEVHIGNTFIEDGEEYEWIDQASDVYYLDFDAWQVWKATSVDSGEDAYFVVDKDTGFIDWGPCGEEEAIEFLRSKVDDYNLDESYSPSNNSIDTLLKINEFDGYRVETYLNELGYNPENTPDLSQIPDDVAKKVVLRIKNDYQNNIDKYGDDAQVPFEAFELLNL